MAEQYGENYKTVQESVTAIQLKVSTMQDVYHFMGNNDVNFRVTHGDVTAVITDKDGAKHNVNKFEWIVKYSNESIGVFTDTDFKKKFVAD